MPAPALSPVQNVTPVIPPTETADSLDRGDGFDSRLGEGDVGRLGYASSDFADRGIRGAADVGVCCTCDPSLGDRDRIAGIYGPRGVDIYLGTGVHAGARGS